MGKIQSDTKKSKDDFARYEKEYEMLRTEICQYMEEYQTVRNMMYVATASVIGLGGKLWDSCYIYLLPLIVILPSYAIFYDYWKAVVCASTYIQIFLEDDSVQTSFHWETRHAAFSRELSMRCREKRAQNSGLGMHFQQLPYYACGATCLVLFWVNAIKEINGFINSSKAINTSEMTFGYLYSKVLGAQNISFDIWISLFLITVGILATVSCCFVFRRFYSVNENEFREIWISIRNQNSHK